MLRCTKIRDFNELQKYCLQINVDRILDNFRLTKKKLMTFFTFFDEDANEIYECEALMNYRNFFAN